MSSSKARPSPPDPRRDGRRQAALATPPTDAEPPLLRAGGGAAPDGAGAPGAGAQEPQFGGTALPGQVVHAGKASNEADLEGGSTGRSGRKRPSCGPDDEELTPSISALFDDGPGKVSGRAAVCAYFWRLFTPDLGSLKLLHWEDKCLLEDAKMGIRAAQYLAWRSTLLIVGAFFFAFITAIEILFQIDGSSRSDNFLMDKVHPRYYQYFTGLTVCNEVQSVSLLVASIFAVICASVAAWKSFTPQVTRWATRASWVCSYIPPFCVLLVIPFRSSVDFLGVQVQMCVDVMNTTTMLQEMAIEETANVVKNAAGIITGMRSMQNQFMEAKGLAQALRDSYGVELPPSFCKRDPKVWASQIRALLDERGVLAGTDGTCALSRTSLGQLVERRRWNSTNLTQSSLPSVYDVSVTLSSDCPVACANCTTVCLPHLMRLTALTAVHANEVLMQMSLGGAERCAHCVASELLCPVRCPQVSLQLEQQGISGQAPETGRACLHPEAVDDFELLLQVGTQVSYWQVLLGIFYAALSLATLLPIALSLMLGAAKGAGIAKSLIPYSRVPTVISSSAVVFSFPFVLTVMILVQNIAGDLLTLVGIFLVLVAFLASLKPGSLKAESTQDLRSRQKWLSRISILFMLAAVVVFFIKLATSDIFMVAYSILDDQGFQITAEDLRTLGRRATWSIVQAVTSVLGQSLISTVFFADAVVSIMHHFHRGEDNDPFSVQCARTKLVMDLDCIFEPSARATTVLPVDGTSVSEAAETQISEDGLQWQRKVLVAAKLKRLLKRPAGDPDTVAALETARASVLNRYAARDFSTSFLHASRTLGTVQKPEPPC